MSTVWLISLSTDLFYNVPDHFPPGMLSVCDLSECLDAHVCDQTPLPPFQPLSRPNLYNWKQSSDVRFKGRAAAGGSKDGTRRYMN